MIMKYPLYALLFCFYSVGLKAQIPLDVSVNAFPPYPEQYSVWASSSSNYMVTILNNSDTQFEVYVKVSFEGTSNDFTETFVRFSEDYIPATGFTSTPGIPLVLTAFDIEQSYNNLGFGDVVKSDNISEDPNGELPSGDYQLCVEVLQFPSVGNDEKIFLSPTRCTDPFGVSQSNIQLEWPYDNSYVSTLSPINFNWSTNSGLSYDASQTYRLKLYQPDSIQAVEESIYELVESGELFPVFTSEPINTTTLFYDYTFGDIELIENQLYAWQVEVVEDNGVFFDNEGKSNIHTFIYGEEGLFTPGEVDTVTQNQIDCFENCNFILPENTAVLTDPSPSSIDVGHFIMDELEITNQSSGFYTGTGRINIPWLNDVFVTVSFDNIKVNSDGRMIDGEFTADQAPDVPYLIEELNNFIGASRLVAGLAGADATLDLPLGISQNIGGTELLIAITDITWTATTCNVNTACNFTMPAFGEDSWLSLESTETCMHPGGFGNEFVMHIGPDRPINSHGDILLNFKGSESSNIEEVKQDATYLEMDCNGLKAISLKADIIFPDGVLVPDTPDGIPGEGNITGTLGFTLDVATSQSENVYAQLGGETDVPFSSGLHFLAKIEIDSFQFKGLNGWGFGIEEAWIDASELSNVPDIVMPNNHDDIVDGELVDVWTGFYLKKGRISCPKEFLNDSERASAQVNHLIIDPSLSMNLSVNELFPIDEGNVDGWALSMDSLFLTIEENVLTEGGFSGELRVPLSGEDESLRYTALITESEETAVNSDLQYVFNVTPENDMTFPFMLADVELSEDSYVEGRFQAGSPEGTYFETFMAGGVGINTDGLSDNSDYSSLDFIPLELPLLDFAFLFHSDDGFSQEYFSLLGVDITGGDDDNEGSLDFSEMGYGTEEKTESLAGLPISLQSFDIQDDPDADFKVVIAPYISLSPGATGFGASTTINIPSTMSGVDIKSLKPTGFAISGASIDIERMGMQFSGMLEFYNDKNAEGVGSKGVKGELVVDLPLGIGMKMAAEFGSLTEDPNEPWNTAANYPYWYFDGMIYFGEKGGIPIAGPIGLYGVGGGISYNMSRSAYSDNDNALKGQIQSDLAMINAANEVADGNNVDASTLRTTTSPPSPSYGVYGLKMAGTIGTVPSATLINMDVAIQAEFTSGDDFRLSLLSIDGDGYLMTPLSQRNDPQVWAGIGFTYSNPFPGQYAFDGSFVAYANIDPFNISLLRGVGPGNLVGDVHFHASNFTDEDNSGNWFLKIGNPDAKCGLEIGFEDILEISAGGYFMLGHDLPTELPVPEDIADLFGETNSKGGNKLTSGTIDGSKDRSTTSINNAKSGKGMAFGVDAKVVIDVSALGIYANLKIFLGFDINITQNEGLFCSNTDGQIGVNGWYGQGQIYGGLEGGLGFRVRFLGKDHDLELFGLKAAMMLSGGGPNPFYADGRVGLQIRVLAGAIKCQKTISVEVGKRCIPEYGNPFGGMPIISETYPSDGDEEVSHFVKPTVSFSLPMDEISELTILDEDGLPKPYYVKPIYENVKIIKENGNEFPIDEVKLLKQGKLMKIDKAKSFKSFKEYQVSMTIKAKEYPYGPNFSGTMVQENGRDWKLDTLITFSTGEMTDINEAIEYAIPMRNQRYFLQDEVLASKDLINFTEQQTREAFKIDNENYSYEYYVRYLCEDDSDPIEIEIDNPGLCTSIDWDMPTLQNNKHYALQLIRKAIPESFLAELNSLSLNNIRTFEMLNDGNGVKSRDTIDLGEAINPVNDLGFGEVALVTYFFKTSKYNTLQEKFDDAMSENDNSYNFSGDELTLNTNENFDKVDTRGLKVDSETIVEPLIRLFDPMERETRAFTAWGQTPYTDFYKDRLDEVTVKLLDKWESKNMATTVYVTGLGNVTIFELPELNIDYDEANPMHRQVVDYDEPLGEDVIEKFGDSEMFLTTRNNINISTNIYTSNTDVKLKFVTFDDAHQDAKDLYEFCESLASEPIILYAIESDDYWGYGKFSEHYHALFPYGNYSDYMNKGLYYLDVYHGKFVSTPISSFKGYNVRKTKFLVD